MQQDRRCFTCCQSFVGKSCAYMECKDDCHEPRCQVLKLLLEDLMRQARNQATILFGIPPTNRLPNGGDEPHAIDASSRVDQEEPQGMGRVPSHHRVCLQPRKTFDYWKVPLRGRLRFQPIIPIGHSSSTITRAHQHGRECPSELSQEDA